jgi:hypothetical protein
MSMMIRMRIGPARRLASALVPLAFAASLPLVQWCPLGSAITLRDCLPGAAWPASAAPPQPNACPASAATCGHCPLQHSMPPARCIGAPMGGVGLRPLSPELHPPALQMALADAVPPVVKAPRELGRIVERADARPPTRSWAQRPPVRGPPLG